MNSVVIPALVVTAIFLAAKYFMDTRDASATEKTSPGRDLIRESVLVCISSILGLLLYNQFAPVQAVVKSAVGAGASNAAAFTEKPNF
jgi:formate hydrogenlyase subunit 3/multisubunit Na+/H+ antiporter MnhD subunit